MDTRSRGTKFKCSISSRDWFYGTTWTPRSDFANPISGYTLYSKLEKITSVRGRRLGGFNTCSHYKVEVHGLDGATIRSGTTEYMVSGCPCGLIDARYSVDWQMSADSYDSMVDSLDLGVATKVLLPNFLVDIVSMKRSLEAFGKAFRHGMPKSGFNGRVLNPAGVAWLFYNYGIKPFVKDLQDIHKTLWGASAKAALMRSMKGKRQRRKIRLSIPCEITFLPSYWPYYTTFGLSSDWSEVETETKTSATLFADYTPTVNVDVSSFDILQRQLGLQSPGSVLWEALPFSFVVDWFINTQNAVRSFDSKMITFPATFGPCGVQIKGNRTITMPLHYSHPVVGSFSSEIVFALSFFIRSPGLPGPSDGSALSGRFGARQASYAAALVNNMLHKK